MLLRLLLSSMKWKYVRVYGMSIYRNGVSIDFIHPMSRQRGITPALCVCVCACVCVCVCVCSINLFAFVIAQSASTEGHYSVLCV